MHLDVDDIRKTYELGRVEDEPFITLREDLNYEALLSSLTNGTVSWKHNTRGDYLHFLVKGLKPICRVWNLFICCSIAPSSNMSEFVVD